MKYHLISLGCQMNLSDTERVKTVLHELGFSPTENENEANILGVIACSVRQKAIDKVYSRIAKWNKLKNRKNLITFVSGCILPSDNERFLKLFDLVFPMSDLPQLPEMIRQYGVVSPAGLLQNDNSLFREAYSRDKNENTSVLLQNVEAFQKPSQPKLNPGKDIDQFWHVEPTYTSDFEAFIPIQNGCDKFCSFCAVPYTRGREVSRPSGEIIEELKSLVAKGYKTITLLGQNVNSYGLDKKGDEIGFAELLRQIGLFGDSVPQEFWVYFTSPHPRDMTDEVIEVISQHKCLGKQIHLPVQSGDDKVLMRMNRKHAMDKYRHIVHTIRKLIPEATLFTDIIVGFTGETDEQFENTRLAMEEFQYNMAYIAQYSVRPGAASSRWEDDVPQEIKKERLHILTQELMKHSLQYNKALVGKSVRVIVRGRDRKEGFLSGHTEGKLVIRFASDDHSLIGQFVDLKINSASPLSLEGELIHVEATAE
jgi:tRNA-2-methylthio-N6-dimethylallyladenosine synthase